MHGINFFRWIMAKFYFDVKNGFATADGALVKDFFDTDNDFALGYFSPDREPLFAKIPVRLSSCPLKGINVCDLGESRYYLSFSPLCRREEAEIIFQTQCHAENISHLVTFCYRGEYALVIETPNEIYEIACPSALSEIQVKAVNLKNGQIIRITANAARRKFIAILLYRDDYLPLFQTFCDGVSFDGADILIKENLGGCNSCVRTRRLIYKNGNFADGELSFIYKRCHDYPDELLPYVFAEKIIFGDNNGAAELLRHSLSVSAVKETTGDFDAVADFEFLPYRPYVIGLYKRSAYAKVQYFRFSVHDGIISDISPCR